MNQNAYVPIIFTARRYDSAMYAVVLRLSVCQSSIRRSVCPSKAGIVPKRLNSGSRKQRRTIAQGPRVMMPNTLVKFE